MAKLYTQVISVEENYQLNRIPKSDEIRKTIFSMSSAESPSLDGMNPNFYKTYWGTVGEDLIKAIQNFLSTTHLHKANNQEAVAVKECLDSFCNISGQVVNYDKSIVLFSANMVEEITSPNNSFPLMAVENKELMHFVAVCFEQILMTRNKLQQ
ncbi:hypothetical protein M9H77_04200 [Catharanthus roseus]|uniref:Uncharacterized protein n=1 Tax=Catharanthus roseus TaxID=4058 RepID=A0ACC0CDD7_CATRO|nr:hypothetical protein M9H77_04200 [Catharanthus roseus]